MRYLFFILPFSNYKNIIYKREATKAANLQKQDCRRLNLQQQVFLQSWALQLSVLLSLKRRWKINKK